MLHPLFLILMFVDGAPVNDPDSVIPHVLHMICCAIVAGIGAAFSSLDREVTVKQMAYYCCLAMFLGSVAIFGYKTCLPTYAWYGCIPLVALIGWSIYGIAVAMRKGDKSIAEIEIPQILKDRLGMNHKKEEGKSDEHG